MSYINRCHCKHAQLLAYSTTIASCPELLRDVAYQACECQEVARNIYCSGPKHIQSVEDVFKNDFHISLIVAITGDNDDDKDVFRSTYY